MLCQQCTRCGTRWPVTVTEAGPVPARWCPRCQGDLSRPFPLPAPQPAGGQRPPGGQPPAGPPQSPQSSQPSQPPQPPQPPPRRPVVTGSAAARLQDPASGRGAADEASPRWGERRARLPRGYRWVAAPPRREDADDAAGRRAPVRPLGPTPRYRRIPQWTLDSAAGAEDGPDQRRRGRPWAARTRSLLTATMVLFALAALAELLRYGLMLRGRTHLVHRVVVALSDSAVLVFGYASMVFTVVTAVYLALWLVRARAGAFAAAGQAEPRRPRWILAGCLIPVVNLVYPGVFLTELAHARAQTAAAGPAAAPGPGLQTDPGGVRGAALRVRRRYRDLRDGARMISLVRFWWLLWVLANVTAAAVALQRLDGSVQAAADGVVYTVYADLLGLAAAAATRIVLDRVEGRAAGRQAPPQRWVADAAAARHAGAA